MPAMADKIMRRVRGKGRGWIFSPKDFIDFGTRGSVDMALLRLVKSDKIRRVSRGLYNYPKMHEKLGALSPTADSLARAIARKNGHKIGPTGADAANRLGLSTQVPAKPSFATNGPSFKKKIAGRTLSFKHVRTPQFDSVSTRANTVSQAIYHIGKDGLNDDIVRQFSELLNDSDMKALIKARPQMTGWMGDAILKIAETRHG